MPQSISHIQSDTESCGKDQATRLLPALQPPRTTAPSHTKYLTSHDLKRADALVKAAMNGLEQGHINTEQISEEKSTTPTLNLPRKLTIKLAKEVQTSLSQTSYTHDDYGLKMDLDILPRERKLGDNKIQSGDIWPYNIRWLYGVIITINFLIFWTIPHLAHSFLWDIGLGRICAPISKAISNSQSIRKFAHKYVYTDPRDTDYFGQTIFTFINFIIAFGWILYCQRTQTEEQNGSLKLWHFLIYYFLLVGLRGGGYAGTFALMHREGHVSTFYRPWIRNSIGNVFENVFSNFYGTVPKNASISHTWLHHSLQGRSGDSFYQFDLDRNSWVDFFAFIHRIGLHQTGTTPYIQMLNFGMKKQARQFLIQGLFPYYIIYPMIILFITRFNWWFFFWVYIQPHLKTVFISAWTNVAFHGFIDFQEDGLPAECCFASEYTNSDLDWLGEDRHLSHHIQGHVPFLEQDTNREKLSKYLGHYQASVFDGISAVQATGLILEGSWDKLATYFKQHNDQPAPHKPSEDELIKQAYFEFNHISHTTKPSVFIGMGRLTLREIAVMLEIRAKRREPKWLRGSWLEAEYNPMPFVDESLHNQTNTKVQFN